MSDSMRRDFADRAALTAYLRAEFPHAAAVDDQISPLRGGADAAAARLAAVAPESYEQSRNFSDGAVTRLSPYIRHGVLTLAAVRDAVRAAQGNGAAGKLLQELAWRDYFQRLYAQLGARVWRDREPYKTGFRADQYADALPADIRDGRTGLRCVDDWVAELRQTGYLHNHARMWLAGYVVHWRRVRWQAGARWFLQHLLDGDPASNNLSWQWVASTFSHKPYFFNRENIEKFSRGAHCAGCPLYGCCEFEGSYADLEKRLFPHKPAAQAAAPAAACGKGKRRWHQ